MTPGPARSFRRDERLWLVGLVLVTMTSVGRCLAAGSPKVDEHYPSEPVAMLLLVTLVVGWALMILGWRGLLARPPESPRRLAFAGLVVAALMLPMLSNDVFSLFAYASLAARGFDVYTTAAWLSRSEWFAWMGDRWTEKVCVYGPTTLFGILPTALSGRNPWLALALLRVAWFLPLVLVMELSFRRLRDQPLFHTMVWLNPLWVLQGPGQLHADLLGLVAITTGIVLQCRGPSRAGWGPYAVGVFSKYSFVFAGLWFWLVGDPTRAGQARRIPAIAVTVAGVGAVLYAPFWLGSATVTEPLRALSGMNPGGSITEVAGYLVRFLRGGHAPGPDVPVRLAMQIDRAEMATTWLVVSLALRAVTLAVSARVLFILLRRPYDEKGIAVGTGIVSVAVITLASHRFQSWYLIAALPFFGLCCPPAWRRWWVAAVGLSVLPEFIQILPRSAAILPVWSVATTAAVALLFLASFRARYLSPFPSGDG
jgi:hypothetical protein